MNQPNPSPSTRPHNVAESPDALAVLRRYLWLVVGGTLLGTCVAVGLWGYLREFHPQYSASVYFQVLPPPTSLGQKDQGPIQQQSPEETAQFIQRQVLYIKSDDVLRASLEQDAFQHDPTTGQRSRWLQEHQGSPKEALKKDLTVEPIPNAGVFKITMTTDTPEEAASMVNAVARVYLDSLRNDNKVNQSEQRQQLTQVVADQSKVVQSAEDDLSEFRKANDISGILNLHNVEVGLLQDMNQQLLKAESDAAIAKDSLDNITQHMKAGDLELSADMHQWVESQPQMLNLSQLKLSLQQDRGVAKSLEGQETKNSQAIEQRIKIVEQQIADSRKTLEDEARQRMLERAQTEYSAAKANVAFLMEARNKKELQVKGLDRFLVQDQQKADAVKNQQDILDDLRQKLTFAQLQSNTDDLRVRKFGSDAIPPDKISAPMWYKYLPVGLLGGFLASFGLAYLFEMTNTRVRTPLDITKHAQLPLLGFVPDRGDDEALMGALSTSVRTDPASMIAESFRQIRSQLVAQANGNPLKTLLVASIAPGGGATTIASNIANAMALNKKRVLLVDANFYQPGLQAEYRNLPAVGLSDVITDPTRLDAAVTAIPELPNLHLLSAGGRPAVAAGEVMESKAFQELLDLLKSRYDLVIFDGAPLSLVSDSISLAARVDGVVAVVRAGEVSRGTVVRIREQLRQVRAHLLGVILNAAQVHNTGYFKQNYRTFYEYARTARATTSATN